jgi:branched-chain amino acid transport system substrate-binding protein
MAEATANPQRKLWNAWRAVAVAATALLAACVPPAREAPRVERPAPVERPVERVAPRPIQPGLPQDAERHRIALLVPLTGSNAGVGRSLQNATQLAILDTRSDAMRITTYDTAAPGGAAAAAQAAIADGARLILGPLLAEEAREVAPIARRARVPVLSFSNDASVAGNGTYILGYLPTQSIERVVNYARSTGVTDFAGLIPAGLYGQRASTAFLRSVEQAGGRVTALETFEARPGSMTSALTKIGRSPFQAILIAGGSDSAATAAPIVRRSGGRTAKLLGTELWNTDTAIGSKAALSGAWFASVPDNYYRQYATKYRGRFGTSPYRLSTLGYDAVLLTVRIARDWRPGDEFPERRLVDRDGFAGLDGAFRFGRDGIAERALEVQEVRSGGPVTVSPAPANFRGN